MTPCISSNEGVAHQTFILCFFRAINGDGETARS